MAPTVQFKIQAKDETQGAFRSLDGRLKSIQSSTGTMLKLFASEKIVNFFKDAITSAAQYDDGVKKSVEGITSLYRGFQVQVAKVVLNNKELVDTFTYLIRDVSPWLVRSIGFWVVTFKKFSDVIRISINGLRMMWRVITGRPIDDLVAQNEALAANIFTLDDYVKTFASVPDSITPVTERTREHTRAVKNDREELKRAKEELEAFLRVSGGQTTPYQMSLNPAGARQLLQQYMDFMQSVRPEITKTDYSTYSNEDIYRVLDNILQYLKTPNDILKLQALRSVVAEVQKGMSQSGVGRYIAPPSGPEQFPFNPRQGTMGFTTSALTLPKLPPLPTKDERWKQSIRDEANTLETEIQESFGSAVENGFILAFQGGRLNRIFENIWDNLRQSIQQGIARMTLAWIKGTSTFTTIQAKFYAFYGKIMASLAKLLTNPFTAGVAALGIGAALFGLSRSLGNTSQGARPAGAYSVSNAGGLALGTVDGLSNNGGQATIIVQGGFLNLNDPRQARQFADALNQITGRRIVLQGSR